MNDWEEDEAISQFSGQPLPAQPARSATVEGRDQLKKGFSSIMSFPEGVVALRFILELTGYTEPLMTFNTETRELNPYATLYNLSKRDLWLNIRELLTPEQRAQIETEEQPWVKVDRQRAQLAETRRILADLL